MLIEWAVRNDRTRIVQTRVDQLDAENSARLDRHLEVVTRTVSPWERPIRRVEATA